MKKSMRAASSRQVSHKRRKVQTIFANLTVEFQFEKGVWMHCTWVNSCQKATRLSKEEAERLITELKENQPGPTYWYERDENGEGNVPPYGLDNFVVRKKD